MKLTKTFPFLCAAFLATPVAAATTQFSGTWSSEPACPDYDTWTYTADTVENYSQSCEYQSVEQLGDSRWKVMVDCNTGSPIEHDITVRRDTMQLQIPGQKTFNLVRCQKP
jgi:hypothetical protein